MGESCLQGPCFIRFRGELSLDLFGDITALLDAAVKSEIAESKTPKRV